MLYLCILKKIKPILRTFFLCCGIIFMIKIFYTIYYHNCNNKSIQDVNEFGTDLKICHYITWSAMDPLQWMGAVRMRVKTADKDITIIYKLSTQL